MARFLSLACLGLLGIGTTHALTVAERDTLVAFYNSANKANALIWNITDEPCRWYGISCTTNTGIKFREQTTDTCIWNKDTCPHTDFHVTHIEMYGDILAGTLPSSLSALSYLRVFTLNFQPRLTGSLPPFTSHPTLYHLEVVETGITGEIPEINPRNDNGVPPANYTKIVLSSNKFTGISSAAVEAGRLNKNAEGFVLIDYSSNNGWMSNPNVIMQVAASLPSTVEVFLCKKCGLTGSIPTAAATRLTNLREIDVSDNQISGTLAPLLHPTDPKLQVVRFDNNPLANNITIVFLSLPETVKSISFYNCSLIGELTPLTNKLKNLEYLDLRYNKIQFGSSSSVFAKHSALGRINLGNNPLNIDVMTLFGALPNPISNLTIFSCRNCGLTGSLSASISSLPVIATLQSVVLSENSISGSFVPLFHPTRSNLLDLEIDHNQLDAAITSPLPFSSIKTLDLSHNKIPDTAPIITGSSLLDLDLSFNKFTANIPDMSNHTTLQSLILSSNQFSDFPTVTPPSSLRILAIDNNMIATSLPSWLISNPVNVTTFPLLSQLLLNNNFLIGNISYLCDSTVGVAPSLFQIDLSHNKLTGSIPPLDQCNSLQQFHATNNQLTGPLPSINYIFTTFDVNLNSLSGAFPVWNADYLQRLNIACNTFAPITTPLDQIMLITPNAYIEQDCYDAGVGTNTQTSCTQRCTRPAIGPTLSPPPTSSPPTKKPTTQPQPTPSGGTNDNNNNTSSSSTGNGMGTSTGQPNNNSNGATIIYTSITTMLMTVTIVLGMIIH